MWSLGKVTGTPEVKRVFISSFWEKPFTHAENKELFEKEREGLFKELRGLPRTAAIRKVGRFSKPNTYSIDQRSCQENSIRPSSCHHHWVSQIANAFLLRHQIQAR
jgi:hypothetical protein